MIPFEELIEDLAAGLVNVPAEDITAAIQDGLEQIAKSLDLQYAALNLVSDNIEKMRVGFHFLDPETKTRIDVMPQNDIPCRFPWFTRMCAAGKPFVISAIPDDFPPEAKEEREYCVRNGITSTIMLTIQIGGEVLGILNFWTNRGHRDWPEATVRRLGFIGKVFANAISRQRADEAIHTALDENRRLREQLEAENYYLRQEIGDDIYFRKIIGRSDALKYVLFRVDQVAPSDATVLILGETGTGKGLLAHAIHQKSARREFPFVTVNCAALPANLIESELFGREKGAFTGAHARQLGRFEVAHQGTIFLDEIGDLPLELQAKLLRVVQDGEFERVGSSKTLKVDARIIAATSRDMKDEIRQKRFREDLYYRLSVFPVTMPPLRNRKDDIPLLVNEFVDRYARKMGKQISSVSREDLVTLQEYSWPGNIRELEGVIERLVITTHGSVLRLEESLGLGGDVAPAGATGDLETVEREHIRKILIQIGGRIEGPGGAAELLGLNPSTLRGRMRRLGIRRGCPPYTLYCTTLRPSHKTATVL